jgi:hypothetical protein
MTERGPVTRYRLAEREADTVGHDAAREQARADRAERECERVRAELDTQLAACRAERDDYRERAQRAEAKLDGLAGEPA